MIAPAILTRMPGLDRQGKVGAFPITCIYSRWDRREEYFLRTLIIAQPKENRLPEFAIRGPFLE